MEHDCILIDGKYKVFKRLGGGGFGVVYQVLDIINKKNYAAKLEMIAQGNKSVLVDEIQVIKSLRGTQGVFKVHDQGENQKFRWVIIDLLGPSIEKILKDQHKYLEIKEKGKLSKQMIVFIGIQMISRIENLHSKGYVHRDLKPDNLAFGLDSKKNFLHLIDFGLAKPYIDFSTREQLPSCRKYNFIGTPLFASRAAHFGYQQFRKDDIQSICYILIYLFTNSLPWHSLTDISQIQNLKISIDTVSLCLNTPYQINMIIDQNKKIHYHDKPDYNKIKSLLRNIIQGKSYNKISIEDKHNKNKISDWLLMKRGKV